VYTGIGVEDGGGGFGAVAVETWIGEAEGARDVATLLYIAVPVKSGVGNVKAVGDLEPDNWQATATPKTRSAARR
jgi:hypothetical protein